MLDVSGNNVTAHYHTQPNEHCATVLKYYPTDGPYNSHLVDPKSKNGPLLFHYTIHTSILASLLRRYQGLYRERLSSSYAPQLRITSDEECRAAEIVMESEPDFPAGWREFGREAKAHMRSLEKEARDLLDLDVCIEYALVAKLVNVIFAPHGTPSFSRDSLGSLSDYLCFIAASWRRIGRDIAAHKAKTAPTFTQRAYKWLSGPFTKRNSVMADVVTAAPTLSPLSLPKVASKVALEAQVESSHFIDSPPVYASPPPYSPPRLSARATSPSSRPSPSPKLLSRHSSNPTTHISHGDFVPIKTHGYLLPNELSLAEGGTYKTLTLGPRIPEVVPTIPLPYKALKFVGDVLGPFVPLLEALVDQGIL
ncbi:hypothetical protein P7C70_g7516, partial [Phenoliferia sp. Uapishka_3]